MTNLIRVLALSSTLAAIACDDGGGGGSMDDPRTAGILMLDGDATAGMAVFQVCSTSSCHGADGNTPGTPDVKKLSEVIPEDDDHVIVETILKGTGAMPSQAHLSDQQIADVVAYVRDTFG